MSRPTSLKSEKYYQNSSNAAKAGRASAAETSAALIDQLDERLRKSDEEYTQIIRLAEPLVSEEERTEAAKRTAAWAAAQSENATSASEASRKSK